RLRRIAHEAKVMAYAPYSQFRVGAALLTRSGQIFTGCNVENASYGAGICAERTAFVKAISEGHLQFDAVCVASDATEGPTWPCGICRQFMVEYGADLEVIATSAADHLVRLKLRSILPLFFGPADL
ncbi:hypothetical protein CXG81DRAFT_4111, partial [Caulochytrium protostelioides]